MQPGDWVIPSKTQSGVWRDYSNCYTDELVKIDKNIGLSNAATLSINPCTAYRLLKDFSNLKKSDSIILNAANSSVGVNLIKMASIMGLKSICVLRDRPGFQELEGKLRGMGANLVIKDDDLGKSDAKDLITDFGKPVIAFDAVGGTSSLNMTRTLQYPILLNS